MRRPYVIYFVALSMLALFAGIAWLTHNPNAEILRRAEGWPGVGPFASRFRQAYRQPDGRPGIVGVKTEETGIRERDTPGEGTLPSRRVYRHHVWALSGMELKAGPSADTATIYKFERLARAGKIERRGHWYHVDYHGYDGWVLLEGYDENAEIPYGEMPDPLLPVPARAPDEQALAAVRKYLRGSERRARLGPYDLYTDSRDDDLISYLDLVTGRLEEVYAERYVRSPVCAAAEAGVRLRSDIASRLVRRQSERLVGLNSAGHNSEGIAVLYSGSRSRSDIASTVTHELTHFLNRRAIGPQLPPWLDEGIADDLALSRIDQEGRIQPSELGGGGHRHDRGLTVKGGLASLWLLRDAARAGKLPPVLELVSADWDRFVHTPKIQLHYATAAMLIRYLIDGDDSRYAAGFRAFLNAIASGEPPSADLLQAKLGEPWEELDAGFRAWIEERAASARLPPGAGY